MWFSGALKSLSFWYDPPAIAHQHLQHHTELLQQSKRSSHHVTFALCIWRVPQKGFTHVWYFSESPTSCFLHCSLPQRLLQAHSFLPQVSIFNCPFSAPQEVCEAVNAVSYPRHLGTYRKLHWKSTLHLRLTSNSITMNTINMFGDLLNILWMIERAAVWSSSGRHIVFMLVTPGCFLCASPFRKSTLGCVFAAALNPYE